MRRNGSTFLILSQSTFMKGITEQLVHGLAQLQHKPKMNFFNRGNAKNKNKQDGPDRAANNNPSAQKTFTTQVEQLSVEEIPLQDLAELLGVTSDVNPSEDGSRWSLRPRTDSAQQKQRAVHLIQESVSVHFPKPPSDLDQNLQQHLFSVQETVCNELMRLSPRLEKMGLSGCLIDCYHRQTLDHISDLFKKVQCCQNSFELMKWVLHTYLSQEVLGHPDLQKNASIQKGDFLLLTELVTKATDLLLENVQKEIRECLDTILLTDRNQEDRDNEESCIRLYVDIIQFTNAMPEEAQKISTELSHDVREVCFQELKMFLTRYTSEQTEMLRKKAKNTIPNQIVFFKTLKTCEEIKEHVQTNSEGIKDSLIQEIVTTLGNMEDVTSNLLMESVADMAEHLLQNYFKTEHNQWLLISGVKTHFSKLLGWCQDIQRRVMDEAYKLIALTYLKHLLQSSQKKLTNCWSRDFVQKVIEDAKSLHDAISDVAPGVQQWNVLLLKIPELLECDDINAVKLTVSSMQTGNFRWSEDEEFLSALLEWKGLYKWEVWEVLDALAEHEPAHRSVLHYIWSVYRRLRMS